LRWSLTDPERLKPAKTIDVSLAYDRDVQPLPKLGRWTTDLDELLARNETKAAREQLTLIRIFEELRGRGYSKERGHSMARPCANQRKKPASAASLTPTTSSEPLKPSTGELTAIIGMPVRDRSESVSAINRNACPPSSGRHTPPGRYPTMTLRPPRRPSASASWQAPRRHPLPQRRAGSAPPIARHPLPGAAIWRLRGLCPPMAARSSRRSTAGMRRRWHRNRNRSGSKSFADD
jgi:hypothetical protein